MVIVVIVMIVIVMTVVVTVTWGDQRCVNDDWMQWPGILLVMRRFVLAGYRRNARG